jgi:hypothetical protein
MFRARAWPLALARERTMKYLANVLDGPPITDGQTSGLASDAEMTAIDAFNDRLRADGHWIFASGLAAPERSTVVDNRRDAGLVTAGPHIKTQEFVAGLWIWDVPNADVALSLAADASKACNRRIEIRSIL